jgi:ribonuclease-3
MSERQPSSEASPALEKLQHTLGYRFRDPRLLRRALTHPSYVNEHPDETLGDNQRLEFLGDAVIDFIAADWVYGSYTDFDEGRMTRLRAVLVRTETLAHFASQVGIGEALRLGHGEEEAGGHERDANLCDAFEAVVGAIYRDAGMRVARAVVEPFFTPVAETTLAEAADQDAKSRLQEWSQAELKVTPHYRIVAAKGPDHAKTFVAEVLFDERVVGQGAGHSKQAAEQAAAQAACESLIALNAAASAD